MKIISLKKYRDFKDSNILYADLMKSSKNPVTDETRGTNAHETSHMISSQLRNENNGNLNGFYYNDSSAVLIDQPNLTIKDVSAYVPNNLRGFRYQLYFVDQLKYWNDSPLYIMEEWNCYRIGGSVAVIDYQQNQDIERTDAVAGTFEFMIYSTALYMAIRDHDPVYFKNNKQFSLFYNYLVGYSDAVFTQGRKIPAYKSQKSDDLYEEYNNSKEGKEFAKFNKELLKPGSSVGFDYL